MTATAYGSPRFFATDPLTGNPLAGGKLYTYETGTTTPKTTWSDPAQTTPNANPVVLSSAGTAPVYLDGSYRFQLRDALDNVIWTMDGVLGGSSLLDASAQQVAFSAYGAIVATNVQEAIELLEDSKASATQLVLLGDTVEALQDDFDGLGTMAALDKMVAGNWRTAAADKGMTPSLVWGDAAEVALTDAATIAVDMSSFLNARVTLGGNRTLGQPSNTKIGQSGCIRIIQDGTGSRTLAFHADWKFANGTDPTLSTVAGTTDLLFFQVIAANFIFASLIKAVA